MTPEEFVVAAGAMRDAGWIEGFGTVTTAQRGDAAGGGDQEAVTAGARLRVMILSDRAAWILGTFLMTVQGMPAELVRQLLDLPDIGAHGTQVS